MEYSKTPYLNLLIIGIFLCALFTYSYTNSGGVYGVECLFLGGVSVFFGKLNAFGAWIANIFFFFGLTLKREKIALKLVLSAVCIVLGLLALNVKELPLQDKNNLSPVKIGFGLYLWMLSFVLLFARNLFVYRKMKQANKKAL